MQGDRRSRTSTGLIQVKKWLRRGIALCAFGAVQVQAQSSYAIGVYYYPGWKNKAPGAVIDYPWLQIKPYPEREPLLGWYSEGDVSVMEQQLSWMAEYGIDYVVFDWYWNARDETYLDHALKAYLQAPHNSEVRYALMWSNDAQPALPKTQQQFEKMVAFWVVNYFNTPQYVKIDGQPLVFIFSVEYLRNNAKLFGTTVEALLARADEIAQAAGLPGIYFVAETEAVEYWVKWFNPENGFSAMSAYNYHRGFSGDYIPEERMAWSYDELDAAYRQSWDWIFKASTLPYITPVMVGWDKRPWGGSSDPRYDRCMATPDQFKAHLQAAKARIDANPSKSLNMALICCWNEYGEGPVLEPTKYWQYQYLEAVRSVFGLTRPAAPRLNAEVAP